jgi:predicted DsbA family dithiol-disulfide isomerase
MLEALFVAYFCESKFISDAAVLEELASRLGVEGAAELLSSTTYNDEVEMDEQTAHAIGITGVPAFVINEKYLVSGAQGADQLRGVIEQAWAER